RPVGGIDAEQRVVHGGERVHRPEGAFPVAVVRGRLGRNQEDQLSPGARAFLGGGVTHGHAPREGGERDTDDEPRGAHHGSPPEATGRLRTRAVTQIGRPYRRLYLAVKAAILVA